MCMVVCREFLQEQSDPLRPHEPFHKNRPGKPQPISALRPIMLTARRLAAEVRSRLSSFVAHEVKSILLSCQCQLVLLPVLCKMIFAFLTVTILPSQKSRTITAAMNQCCWS